jgi:hypothetical protein
MAERKILNGWKEIASHVGRSVRTVQRWEFTLGMPIHRPANKSRSSVTAFTDEIENWISRTDVSSPPYIRPIVLVLDKPDPDRLTNRKLALEIEKFNVLTAYTLDELFATAEHSTYDAIVMNALPDGENDELCRVVKEQLPSKPLFVVAPGGQRPECADHIIPSADDRDLVTEILNVFGKPKVA